MYTLSKFVLIQESRSVPLGNSLCTLRLISGIDLSCKDMNEGHKNL